MDLPSEGEKEKEAGAAKQGPELTLGFSIIVVIMHNGTRHPSSGPKPKADVARQQASIFLHWVGDTG